MRRWLFEKLGGLRQAFELIEDSDDKTKRELFHLLSKPYFNLVNEDDVLLRVGDKWTHKGRTLTNEQVKQLAEEAAAVQSMRVYGILIDEIRHVGNQRLYERSSTEMDIIAAKSILYLADVIDSRITQIANIRTVEPRR